MIITNICLCITNVFLTVVFAVSQPATTSIWLANAFCAGFFGASAFWNWIHR